jgi:hypothetical protein
VNPSDEQKQRAAWDLLLLDIETRAEQVRQLKAYTPQRLAFAGLAAGATLLAAGAALGGLAVALLLGRL